mmetsp:Transcript_11758/g.21419  ORF Transcript_11758/g.21419 Transcript_11758/m.21419 type:complete len:236 (+) Transcript_11758:1203-1910(+)
MFDGCLAPYTTRSIKPETTIGSCASRLFDHMMNVKCEGVASGQKVLFRIVIPPRCLNHTNLILCVPILVKKGRDCPTKKVWFHTVIGIQHSNEFTLYRVEMVEKITSFVPFTIRTCAPRNIDSSFIPVCNCRTDNLYAGQVGRVIQNMDRQLIPRPINRACTCDGLFDNPSFIVGANLNRHVWFFTWEKLHCVCLNAWIVGEESSANDGSDQVDPSRQHVERISSNRGQEKQNKR